MAQATPITAEDLTNALKPIFERFDVLETRLDAIDIRLNHIEQDIGRIDQNIRIIAEQGGYGYEQKRKIVPARKKKVG